MAVKKHANRKTLSESEFRELSDKVVTAARLFIDLEFRVKDITKNRFIRSDRLVKFNSSIYKDIKKAAQNNESLTISSLISEIITPALSIDLKSKKQKVVLFDLRSNTIIDGGKEIISLQRPLARVQANILTDDDRDEIKEIQAVAASQINDAEYLSWEPEKTVCQGYIQALIERYGFDQIVSAAKSAKKELA